MAAIIAILINLSLVLSSDDFYSRSQVEQDALVEIVIVDDIDM